MAIEKVTDPAKKTTDPVLLSHLAKVGIDPDFVEFVKDYGPRESGSSPYSKRYEDRKSRKKFFVCQGLPMCRADGTKLTPGWERGFGEFHAKTNLFTGTVEDNGRIALSPTNDQPNGMKVSDTLAWKPQLYLDGIEVLPVAGPILLPSDPENSNYLENTLEWDYGPCKRRIRAIEGRLRERWIFIESPGADIRIVHNHTGKGLQFGKYAVDDDVEFIPLAVFQQAEYPLEISAGGTFYPDAHVESTSVDGRMYRFPVTEPWATIKAGAGIAAEDDVTFTDMFGMYTGTNPNWQSLVRSITVFDASAASGIVLSVSLSFYGKYKADSCNILPEVNVYSANPANNNVLVAADFTALGTTKYCATNITFASWSLAGYNDFILNATGKSHVQSAINGAGICKFGTREAKYDAGSSTPTHPGSSGVLTTIQIWQAERGAGYKPKLVIEVVVAPTVTTVAAINITGVGARIKGNVTDTGGENPTRYFQYGKTVAYELGSINKGAGGTGEYYHDLTGLDTGQIYYYRAYATNSGGTGYGIQRNFTTISDVDKSLSASFEAEAIAGRKLKFPLSATVETEASLARKLRFPLSALLELEAETTLHIGLHKSLSVSFEIEAEAGRKLVFPLSSLVEVEATGPLHIALFKALSVSFEVEVEAGKRLQFPSSSSFEIEAKAGRKLSFPLSSLIEVEADGTFRAGLEKSASVLIEMEAAAGRHLVLPLESLIEVEAVAGRHLIKPLSALIEVEAVGELALLIPMIRKQQLLLEITTEEQVTH